MSLGKLLEKVVGDPSSSTTSGSSGTQSGGRGGGYEQQVQALLGGVYKPPGPGPALSRYPPSSLQQVEGYSTTQGYGQPPPGYTQPPPVVSHLAPIQPPLGIFGHYCVSTPTILSFPKADSAYKNGEGGTLIKDQNDVVVVTVIGKAMSMRDKKSIVDRSGNVLFTLRSKLDTATKTLVGEDISGIQIFVVTDKTGMGSKLSCKFTNFSTGIPTTVVIKGNLDSGKGNLQIKDGPIIAEISTEKPTGKWGRWLQQTDTNYLSVAPGVDLSLVTAIYVCYHILHLENKQAIEVLGEVLGNT